MAEYRYSLGVGESLDVDLPDIVYGEMTFYSTLPIVNYETGITIYCETNETVGQHVIQTFNYNEQIKLSFPSFSTGVTSTPYSPYVFGMKWIFTIDIDNDLFKVILPNGNLETYPLEDTIKRVYNILTGPKTYADVVLSDKLPSAWGGDTSETGGGEGDADNTSDDITIPALPSISALNTSLIRMYNPDLTQLTGLANFLWSSTFVDGVVKLFQDPMEAVLGLSMVYLTPSTGALETMLIGKVSSGVDALRVTNQYITLDCGSVNINEYWGNALDYDPHTKIQIYLPFIGIQTLSADDVMGATVSVKYNIDILSGACMCFISSSRTGLNSILYSFSGNVSAQIPLSGRDMSSVISSIIGIVASAGLTAVTGGASAPLVAGSAMSMLNAKQHIQKSGRLDSAVGVLGIKTPYLIITRPVQSLAENYNSYRGFPSNITKQLSELTGYTEVETVYMKGITATENEIEMIENMLKGGVIL